MAPHTPAPRGFTLIELLVVLAIVATLLTLVAPRYVNQLEGSRESVLRENLHTVRQVIDQFYGDKGRYPDSLDELVELRYLRALPRDPITDATDTWEIEPAPEGQEGNVYSIRSGAPGLSRSGEPYANW